MKIVAITCARMDSKRFPGKCLALLNGKPLLQYTIDFARALGIQLYTWTRDPAIIDYVKDKTPILYEPLELYDTPHNSTYEKMQYANKILDADYLIILQPTQPIRWKPTIVNIISEIIEKKIDCAFTYDENVPDFATDVEEDGAFYSFSYKYLLHKGGLHRTRFANCYTFDINTKEDIEECERWIQQHASY